MLDALSDFWKPVKKDAGADKLKPELLQVGSSLGFGFVPQALLSGRRLTVTAINTYQFGGEALTSFALSQDKDPGVAMIIAESAGEQYLAISRRVSLNERGKLFDERELEAVMTRSDAPRLSCRDNLPDFKGWVVASYKREIQGMKGRIFKGDYRKMPLPSAADAQEFDYTLLVSGSNEHAIEIEKYSDGRIELYATVYRRVGDIGEILHPGSSLSAAPTLASPPKLPEPSKAFDPKPAPIRLPEFSPAASEPGRTESSATDKPISPTPIIQEKPVSMSLTETSVNGASMNTTPETMKPKLYVQPSPQEGFKPDPRNLGAKPANFESDAIECELRVANKIIDEAIRNEMRLTDVVRRIIELPVAYQEAVQIPVNLSDEDFALLAIRYGIPATDRNSIKRRIIEDLNDFSGGKKKVA